MQPDPDTLRITVTVLGFLSVLVFNVLALFRMWSLQKTEQEKLKIYVDTKFIEITANNERIDKDLKIHERLNERQLEKYHNETREDFRLLDKKLDTIQGYLMNNKPG